MADPFDILANPGPVSSRPAGAGAALQQQQQQQSSPQPGWQGMMNQPAAPYPAASTPMVHQHQRPPYGPPSGVSGGYYQQQQQQNIMQMGQPNSAALPPSGSGVGYPLHPGMGQQQQQHPQQQQIGGAATAASWRGLNSLAAPTPPAAAAAAASAGPFPSEASAAGWNPAYGQTASPTITSVATPQAPMQISAHRAASGSTVGVGGAASSGAEWMPPAEQLEAYDSMYRTASAGCPVPGTVSGRAAVQFFSRSALSKDVLKTIWSLCDPSLTGSIGRPGFFAAMRLIALAQQQQQQQQRPSPSSPPGPAPVPSLSALEATRHANLPLPGMEGFPTNPSLVAGSAGGGQQTPPAVAPFPPAAAAPASAASQFAVAGTAGAAAPTHPTPSGNSFSAPAAPVVGGVGRIGGVGGGVAMGDAGVAWGASGAGAPSTEGPPAVAPAVSPAVPPAAGTPATAPVGEAEEEEDDFGDFEGSQQEPQQQQPQLAPRATPIEQQADDDGDDFGDFSGAAPTPSGGQALPTAASPAVSPDKGVVSSTAPGLSATAAATGDSWDASTAWMTADSEGADAKGGSAGPGGGKEGGGDHVLKTTSQEAAEAGPADTQTSPPVTEKSRDPVMVDRAAIAREKLSVFDAMADLDLAVGQEDWNDFADETTAPPRSPTPSPPASPPAIPSPSPATPTPVPASAAESASPSPAAAAAAAATAGATAIASAAAGGAPARSEDIFGALFPGAAEAGGLFRPDAPSLEPSLWNGGDSSSTTTTTTTSSGGGSGSPLAVAPAGPQQQHHQWPALGQQGPSAQEGSASLATDASIPRVAATAVAAPAVSEAESQDEDWGDFEDATPEEDHGEAGGRGEAVPEGGGAPLPSAAGGGEAVEVFSPGASEDGDGEEWGTFADAVVAPAATAGGSVEAGAGEVGASTAGSASTSAGPPETPQEEAEEEEEEATDPFADIAPATPTPPRPLSSSRSPSTDHGDATGGEQQERPGIDDEGSLGDSSTAAAAAAATSTVAAAGLPLSLRGLRDALAKRGRLEEAVEVQRRMEQPPSADNKLGEDDGGQGEGGGGDRDLDRWRAAVDLPPRPTVEELAGRISAADAARGERFRERFVHGREPVEDEALAAGGGARALATAVKRQRAARRAVYLSSVLGAAAATGAAGTGGDGDAGMHRHEEEARRGEAEGGGGGGGLLGSSAVGEQRQTDDPDLDFGLDSGAARSPPSLADWALMTAHVTRMAEAGIEALKGSDGAGDADNRTAATGGPVAPKTSPPSSPLPPISPFSQPSDLGEAGADAATADGRTDASAGTTKGQAAAVRAEVARSEKFESFARGLREAVKVCRMLQAAAEDGCLEGVDGFASMERAWAELRRCAVEAAGDGGDSGLSSIFDAEGFGAEAGGGKLEPSGAGGGGSAGEGDTKTTVFAGSVKAMREACVESVPADSELCAVSLQPLAVFSQGGGGGGGGGAGFGQSSLPPGAVEYCGVRYLACAVNLWVNVLDHPPPPLAAREQ